MRSRCARNAPSSGASPARRAAEHAASVEPQRVNFASVYVEQATARRQLMLAAQIRKHVDADAPIRFLIAETESPVTVLAAIALADRVALVPDGVPAGAVGAALLARHHLGRAGGPLASEPPSPAADDVSFGT